MMNMAVRSRENLYTFGSLITVVVLFGMISILIGSVDAMQLNPSQRTALQTQLRNILIHTPVNIPKGGRWDNHYCKIGGAALSNGPDGKHRDVLKLIVEKPCKGKTIANACQEQMIKLIGKAADRLPHNADVTLGKGGYTITPLDNDGNTTTFHLRCYDPKRSSIIQGPQALVLQLNAAANGFAHIYPR